MKILIVGAGGIAGYMAYRFSEADADITILSRGKRIGDLARDGIRVRDGYSGELAAVPVRAAGQGEITEGMKFDLVLVAVRAFQVEQVLPILRRLSPASPVVFTGCYLREMDSWVESLGKERVFFAFPGNAAVREGDGDIVYVDRSGERDAVWGITLGRLRPEHDDSVSDSMLQRLEGFFRQAGLPVYRSGNMETVFFSQMVVRLPVLAAVHMAGGSLEKLFQRGDLLSLMVHGVRELLAVLKALGHKPVPSSLEMYRWVPVFISANMMKNRFHTLSSKIGIEAFGACSFEETSFLSSQILRMTGEMNTPRDHLLYLLSDYLDEDGEEPLDD